MAKLPKEVQVLLDKIYDEDIETVRATRKLQLGRLYLWGYDPKFKKSLPVYDVLPLGILLSYNAKYFWMINIHYIPYLRRIQFMRIIMEELKSGKKLKYKTIKKAWMSAQIPMAYARLAFRCYLISHVKTNLKMFDYDNYAPVVKNVLPIFKKQSKATVYKNIERELSKHRKKLKDAGMLPTKSKKKKA